MLIRAPNSSQTRRLVGDFLQAFTQRNGVKAWTVKRKQKGLMKGSRSSKKWPQDYGFEELTSLQQVTYTIR